MSLLLPLVFVVIQSRNTAAHHAARVMHQSSHQVVQQNRLQQLRSRPVIMQLVTELANQTPSGDELRLILEMLQTARTEGLDAETVETQLAERSPVGTTLVQFIATYRNDFYQLLMLIVTVLACWMTVVDDDQEQAPPLTPEQVEEIIERVIEDVDDARSPAVTTEPTAASERPDGPAR